MTQGDEHSPTELVMVVLILLTALGGALYGWLAVGNVLAVVGGLAMGGVLSVFLVTLIALVIHSVSERVGSGRRDGKR